MTDIVQVKKKLYSGQYYPDVNAQFSYTVDQEGTYIPTDTYRETRYVRPNDTSKYQYNLGEYVGVGFNLPNDTDITYDYIHESYKYYDFFLKLEVRFTPTSTTINGATFAGWYEHQTGSGSIDWGNITLTLAYPYFSYSTAWWRNDPTFDAGIGGLIVFENIG